MAYGLGMTTTQIPGPVWYRLRFLGALIAGAGVLFVALTAVGDFSQSANGSIVPFLDAGLLTAGAAMLGGSIWVRRVRPEWK